MRSLPPRTDPARGPALALATAAVLTIVTILGLLVATTTHADATRPARSCRAAVPVGSVAVGDYNLPPGKVGALAVAARGRLIPGRHVDNAITTGQLKARQVLDLGPHGSDHHALLYDLTVTGRPFRVLAWNVYVGNDPANVIRQVRLLVGRWSPAVVVLNEAYRLHNPVTAVDGYHGIRGTTPEGRAIVVLVRDDVTTLCAGWATMGARWVGPIHGLEHPPRSFGRVRLELPSGVVVRLLGLHMPTGGFVGRNVVAVREAAARVVEWLRR